MKKQNSGKVRFGGLLKILVGLCFFLPAPVLAAPGGVMNYVGNEKINALTARFMDMDEGRVAMAAKESRLATLRQLRDADAISLEEYNHEVSYLNSPEYVSDAIKAGKLAGEYESAEKLEVTGKNLALTGGLGGAAGTLVALYIGEHTSSPFDGNKVLSWFRHGGRELATGRPWDDEESEG